MHNFSTVGSCTLTSGLMTRLGFKQVTQMIDSDIIVFLGGEDVSPELYGDVRHYTTHASKTRDRAEQEVWNYFKGPEVLKVGICRGGQFLNVMNGGKMWQDVNYHTGSHSMIYIDENGERTNHFVTSTHHQMMIPGPGAEIWGIACQSTYRDKGTDERRPFDKNEGPDIEILFYPETRSLCFQPHPEYHVQSCEDLFSKCLQRIQSLVGVDN